MFVFLRYFYTIGLILVTIGAVAVGMVIYSMATDNLQSATARTDTALAQSFANSVWLSPSQSNTAPMTRTSFQEKAQRFVSRLDLLQLRAYDHQGRLLFQSNAHQLTDSEHEPITFPMNLLSSLTSPVSMVLENVSGASNIAPEDEHTILQTIAPIHNPAYSANSSACQGAARNTVVCLPILGYVEVLNDLEQEWGSMWTIQLVSSSSIIAIFLALISVLFVAISRAESIIAKQHEVNLELTAAAASAEAENRDKSQFLANISHELRTPLNAIIGFSEILKKEALNNLSPTHQEYIIDIYNSGSHLLSLINDILDFSKAEAGKLELELAEVDLSKLVINSMRLVIPRAEEAQVTLVENLPPEHVVGVTDNKKLKQVLLNLLSNAVKFTPPGGEVRISLWERKVDDAIYLQVKDTGIGIAPKDIAKVMSPFGQVDSKLSRKYEGTGLGLPLSKKFVEIMGGQFIIESEVGEGTTITLKFPRSKPEEPQQAEHEEETINAS